MKYCARNANSGFNEEVSKVVDDNLIIMSILIQKTTFLYTLKYNYHKEQIRQSLKRKRQTN